MIIGWVIISLIFGLIVVIIIWPHYCIRLISRQNSNIIFIGPGNRDEVALTIDDGPDPVYTPQILDLLAIEGLKATFFVVGDRVRRYPEIVRRICAEGHEIGNHSGSWKRTLFLPQRQFESDLEDTDAYLSSFPCAKKIFRPSGIWIRPAELEAVRKRGYLCVLGSAY